jgi:protein kinase X
VGIDPFADDDPINVYNKILECKLKFPLHFDVYAKKIIKRLIEKDLSKRYGNLVNGVNDIKNHKFFESIDFDKLLNMQLKPPYIPKVISDEDISNFSIFPDSRSDSIALENSNDPFLNW